MNNPLVYLMHIPKTAGMSLQQLARRYYNSPSKLFLVYDNEANTKGFDDNIDYEMIMGHFRFGYHKHSQRPTRYFTFLREPVKQVISHYQYTKDFPEKFTALPANIHNIIDFAFCPYGNNLQTRFISGIENIKGKEEEALAKAKENLHKHFEHIGITEEFDASLIMFAQRLGWKNYFYEKKNEGKAKKKLPYPTPEEIEKIRTINQYDIALYEYAYTLFQEQKKQYPNIDVQVNKFQKRNYWFWKLNPFYTRLKVIFGLSEKSLFAK